MPDGTMVDRYARIDPLDPIRLFRSQNQGREIFLMKISHTPETKAALMRVHEPGVREELKFPLEPLMRGITEDEMVRHFIEKLRNDPNAFRKFQTMSDGDLWHEVSGKVRSICRGGMYCVRFGHQRLADKQSRWKVQRGVRHHVRYVDRRDRETRKQQLVDDGTITQEDALDDDSESGEEYSNDIAGQKPFHACRYHLKGG